MGSGDYECELESVKIIDDIENKAWRLQAMSANLISKETAMSPMGIPNPTEEFKKILEEQRREQEESQRMQEEMEMSQMGLVNPEDPNGQSGDGQVTPENVNQEADQMARQLLEMPETERRRQLTAIRNSNDTLHALVLKKMEQLRNQARSMGMQQALPEVVQNVPIQ
jgi:capsid protein